MTKVMRYENGKAITGQVDAPFKVDWSEWQTMTDAQKKGKKWLIENVPGAEGEIDADLLVPLWTNPSPTASFAQQNITLSSNDYDMLLINFSANVGFDSKLYASIICKKGESFILNVARLNYSRNGVYISDSSYNIQTGIDASGNQSNNYCVPTSIYGIKKTVKIKFDALAKDVSTLASKCMLEDGETSVEEAMIKNSDFIKRSVLNTTNQYGQLYLGGNIQTEDMISATSEGYVVIPFKGSSGWNCIIENYVNGSRIANQQITVEYIVKLK